MPSRCVPARPLTRLPALAAAALLAACNGVIGGGDVPAADVPSDRGDASTGLDVPTADRPVMDVPATDVPGLDVPGFDAPGFDAPGFDAPSGDAPGPVIPSAHPRIYLNTANTDRLRALLSSSYPAATRFRDMVNGRLGGGDVYEFQAWFAALMYRLSGEARYADFAIAQVDAWVTSEEALIASHMRAEVSADSYLYIGEHVGDLALTYDWCFDRLTPAQRTRWLAYANQAVWNVWHHAEAQWGGQPFDWSGWSVDNPVNNYYFSFLRATMLLGLASYGEDPQAATWVRTFREDKIRAQLVPTYLRDLAGGGSREGTGYGVSMAGLFRLYDQWQASTGEPLADQTPHARASLAFMIHSTVPTLDRIAPHGDHARDSTAALFDYHRDYTQVLMALYPTDPMAQRARAYLEASSVPRMGQGFMFYSDFLYATPAITAHPLDDVYPGYYGAGTGYLFVRSGWERTAVWASFICGPYTESHAHQDQGSLMVYRNEWLAFDENVLSHSGIQQGVRVHNLVRIDRAGASLPQRDGGASRLLALQDRDAYGYYAGDVAPIYDAAAAVTLDQREVVYLKPDVFVVFDRVHAAGTRVFQLNTPLTPVITGRQATMRGATSALTLFAVSPATAALTSVAWPGEDPDMSGGYRLEVTDTGTADTRFVTVLSVDGGATAATADDSGGMRGVRVTLRDGGTATVRFNDATPGATLTFRRGDGAMVFDGPLNPGVEALPLFRR